ncbi:uncharacterized protein LOC128736719 [Sabethes cyaneus]|uniref:uncharacterized protein LOC128736719 n=1 Tax=Sabethes cyaneus TaxID=53552 RepID=UPI00237D91C0|nr:uncharacterized protein LOC128736719 [Sabethes cyaneus]
MESRICQILALVIVLSVGMIQMTPRTPRQLPGGSARPIPLEELKQDEHINRVNRIFAASGGYKPAKPEILSGTVQLVAGSRYVYTVSFLVNGESQVCDISAWERPWLEEVEPNDAYKYENKCN